MILYLRYCRTGVLFHITVDVKDQYVTTYDDVILVKPNRISIAARLDAILENAIIQRHRYVSDDVQLFAFSNKHPCIELIESHYTRYTT